jgi:hypothetical protein
MHKLFQFVKARLILLLKRKAPQFQRNRLDFADLRRLRFPISRKSALYHRPFFFVIGAQPFRSPQLNAPRFSVAARWSASARADWKLRHSTDLTAPWTDAVVQPTANASYDALELIVTPGPGAEFWQMQVLSVDP